MTIRRFAAMILLTGMAVAGAYIAWLTASSPSDAYKPLQATGEGPLDGMTFTGMIGPEGAPKDVADRFVFENGTFVSKECELRCDYPARPYKAWHEDGAWHFVSKTRCPYKDATIVWRGRVEDGRIEGSATWTIRRWYWTLERDFAYEATRPSPRRATAQIE